MATIFLVIFVGSFVLAAVVAFADQEPHHGIVMNILGVIALCLVLYGAYLYVEGPFPWIRHAVVAILFAIVKSSVICFSAFVIGTIAGGLIAICAVAFSEDEGAQDIRV